uniref:Uncharacterized protein n=1 Tax=virus sp. ctkyY8 TaxID=2827995 RepID=A0A8S5RF10_9VIRU|nr:MAG TPA: hypothetical protein [virus sp. ctkyY8]
MKSPPTESHIEFIKIFSFCILELYRRLWGYG